MPKIKDCVECGSTHRGWARIKGSPMPGARMLAKEAIRNDKKFHGNVNAHAYNFPNFLAGMVVGMPYNRQLLHKGGKP